MSVQEISVAFYQNWWAKLPLYIGHDYVISSTQNYGIWLIIHAMTSTVVNQIPVEVTPWLINDMLEKTMDLTTYTYLYTPFDIPC